jgi:hypothetical protein
LVTGGGLADKILAGERLFAVHNLLDLLIRGLSRMQAAFFLFVFLTI